MSDITHPSRTVYVVDNDQDFVARVSGIVAKFQANIALRTFSAPGRAIAELLGGGNRPELIVTDLIFPGPATGLDVLRSARARCIPCIVRSEVRDVMGEDTIQDKDGALDNLRMVLSGL